MEFIVKIAIYIHAFFGTIALVSGLGSMLFKKGSSNHKKSGKLFSIAMLISSVLSLPIAWMPNHENMFLFLIGIFTIYLVLSGNRILLFKNKSEANFTDKLITMILFVAALFMLFFGSYFLLNNNSGGILFLFFGLIAFVIALRDFRFHKNIDKTKVLNFHIGKMSGAYIASVTAFLVAGLNFQGILYWILPSVVGTFFIIYWTKKMRTI